MVELVHIPRFQCLLPGIREKVKAFSFSFFRVGAAASLMAGKRGES